MTMKEFLASLTPPLQFGTVQVFSNPNMEDDSADKGQRIYLPPPRGEWVTAQRSHWQCKLSRPNATSFVFHFSQGSAHHDKRTGQPLVPKLEDVLDCLASDASSIEDAGDFAEWANDLGMDTDSRKAERTYNLCKQQADKLRRLLGREDYDTLLWSVERL